MVGEGKMLFARVKGTMDKERDARIVAVEMSDDALLMLDDFAVKSGVQKYRIREGNEDRVKDRYLVRRSVSDAFDMTGQMGTFFDKADMDGKVKVRKLFVTTVADEGELVRQLNNFFEFVRQVHVEMKKVNTYDFVCDKIDVKKS